MRNTYVQHCDYSSRFRILKGGKISLVVSAFLATATLLHASPSGGVVTSGSASIAANSSTTTITQSTNKASINWQNFSIAKSETVNFNQPNTSSITLNRVVGNEKSIIDGALNANGQVWILNSNGVLFGKNASINTSGLLATTKALSDADFQAGNYTFRGESSASVINLGEITIANGGYASLLANSVSNEGTIKAIKGTVTLTGANEATINLNGNSLVSLHVNKGVLDALVENKGAIFADGGKVYLTTNAVNELLRGVVNNTGIIEANSIDDITGKIELFAHGGTTNVSGTLSATEGFIETSGETLHVKNDVNIKAKEWLLDPTDITIANGGTDGIDGSSIDADTITTVLNGGTGVTLTATNDITVDEAITWASATQLKLTSSNTIHVNATIANTNTTNGGVYFNANNTTDKVIFDTNGKVMVYNPYQLQWINTALNGNYELGGNIDASSIANFTPIGNSFSKFNGSFDGLGHTIDTLKIDRSGTSYTGLFGYTGSSSVIQNIGLTNVDITGNTYVGGLVGENYGSISNAYATGSVNGDMNYVGGLVGYNNGSISNAYTTGIVTGYGNYVGGLVGFNDSGSISNAYATGSVNGYDSVGGLVGWNEGIINNAYATGIVNGHYAVGGLVGYNNGGIITNSYFDTHDTGISGVGQNDGFDNTVGIAPADAFTKAKYLFDSFDTYWYMIEGQTRPFLRSEYSTTITNSHQLQLMAMNLSASYTLANNITYANDGMWSSAGFVPIGNASSNFNGSFDGLGHTIDALTINRSGDLYVGLFGDTDSSSVIQNIGLTHVNITGWGDVGGLVGLNGGTITNAYTTGSVTGTGDDVGGLVGGNYGSISNAYATGSVTGNDYVGGLVGWNNSVGTITNAYATGIVTGYGMITGGLVGYNVGGITASFWNTETSGQPTVGVGGGSSLTGVTGKTTAQLQQFSTFKDAGWDIEGDSTLATGTPVLTMNGGTPVWKIKVAATPTPTPTTVADITSLITPIVNGTVIRPPVLSNFTPPTPPVQAPQQFSFGGEKVQLVSVPSGDTPNQLVGTQEARAMILSEGAGDLRVPLGQNSQIQLINGGVHLPEGLEQEFFMAQR